MAIAAAEKGCLCGGEDEEDMLELTMRKAVVEGRKYRKPLKTRSFQILFYINRAFQASASLDVPCSKVLGPRLNLLRLVQPYNHSYTGRT